MKMRAVAYALGLMAVVGIITCSAVINGFVLMLLWAWFIVPTFGLPMLSLATSIGLDLVVSLLTGHPETGENYKPDGSKVLSAMFVRPIIYLIIGLFVRMFA
jgi:hypothetical protein